MKPIHPYDVYDVIVGDKAVFVKTGEKRGEEEPIFLIDGEQYYQTCNTPYKSTSFE